MPIPYPIYDNTYFHKIFEGVFKNLASVEHKVRIIMIYKLEKWYPLLGERVHSLYFWSFQKQNREGGENKTSDQSVYPRL